MEKLILGSHYFFRGERRVDQLSPAEYRGGQLKN